MLKNPQKDKEFASYKIEDSKEKHQARKLHASVYLRKGFIDSWEITEEGVIHDNHDSHHSHSRYFAIKKRTDGAHTIVATARQITSDKTVTFADFPMYQHAKLSESGKAKIDTYDPKRTVEISGLVKLREVSPYAVLLLYRLMWQYSYRNHDDLWLMACSPTLYKRLKFLFGESIVKVGDPSPYKGEDVIPAILDVKESVKHLYKSQSTRNIFHKSLKKNMLHFFLEDI